MAKVDRIWQQGSSHLRDETLLGVNNLAPKEGLLRVCVSPPNSPNTQSPANNSHPSKEVRPIEDSPIIGAEHWATHSIPAGLLHVKMGDIKMFWSKVAVESLA